MAVKDYPTFNNPVLEENFSKAANKHGHKCSSLFYGVKLAMKAIELSKEKNISINNVVMEGSSKCIKDGVFSVLGNTSSNIRVSMEPGNCSLSFGDDAHNVKIAIPKEIRSNVDEMKEKYGEKSEEFKKEGLHYLSAIEDSSLFSLGEMEQEEFNNYFEES